MIATKVKVLVFTAILFFYFLPVQAQDECLVLMPQISGEYKGKCKNGFAHGRGTSIGMDTYKGTFREGLPFGKGEYLWSTGERYEGEFEFGKREGKGTFYYIQDNEPVSKEGMWIDNQYAGPIPESPRVITSTGIERFNFQRQSKGNRVQVTTYLNGQNNVDLKDLTFYGSSGSEFRSGGTIGYEAIIFPFRCRIVYYSWNKAHTVRNLTRFEFTISQPGKWQVNLHNN